MGCEEFRGWGVGFVWVVGCVGGGDLGVWFSAPFPCFGRLSKVARRAWFIVRGLGFRVKGLGLRVWV